MSRVVLPWWVFCLMTVTVALTASWSILTQVIYQKYSRVKLVSPILNISRIMAMSFASKDHLGYGKLSSSRFGDNDTHHVYRKIVCSFRILKPCSTYSTPQVGIPQGLSITLLIYICTYYRVWFFKMARKNRDFPHFNGPGSSVGRWWTYTISLVDCR